jgi:uncharacterized membrane protein
MHRGYRMLLWLYPREYRLEFGEEMLAVFARRAAEQRALGWAHCARFLLHETFGILASAARERPAWLHFVPALGGISVAALLHLVIYAVMFKLFDAVGRAIGHISFSTQEPISQLIAMTLCVATLVGLLPLFFLLNMRLLQRRR